MSIGRHPDGGRAPTIAEALLAATNRFIAADDVDALVTTVVATSRAIFSASKVSLVLFDDAGHGRLAGSSGLPDDEVAHIREALASGTPFVERAGRAVPWWSDETGPLGDEGRARLARYGMRSGFSLPIRTSTGIRGVLAILFEDDRPIDDTTRVSGRSMAAQAGLALEMILAREALQAKSAALESTVAERTIQLRQAVDELLVANKARTEFLANVSHELRTPLTAILGFSDLLLQGLDGPLTEVQLDDLRTIDRSGRHLLELIDDLIDVSRIDAGRLELRPEPVDLGMVMTASIEEVRALAGAKGLALWIVPPPDPIQLMADPVRVREILFNLLGNAVKFTARGGTVRVTAERHEDEARVVVEDTGIGIAPEHQERIFDKFHRVAGPEFAGTGLGLALAREYAERHGGSLTVQSALGRGSRFLVRLPLAGPPRDDEAAA